MSDLLLELGKMARARALVSALGLPIPLPQLLKRERGPWTQFPLADAAVAVGAATGAELVTVLAEALAGAGADSFVDLPQGLASAFQSPGETFGRPAKKLEALAAHRRLNALVFDASGVRDIESLRSLYEFFHPLMSRLARSSRVVVLARSPEGNDAETTAAQAALDGFVRSVAKEIGRIGATANLVVVARGAERRLAPLLRFVLSARAAFISAQPIGVTSRAKALDEPALVRPLEKKIALVTGAARGIGEATARALALEGAHVVCLDRPAEDGPTSQLARAIGGTAMAVDVGEGDAPAKIAAALTSLGGVDVVVHNAGITRDKTLARMPPEHWDHVLAVNLASVIRITAALERLLPDNGRIVCLSSIAGLAGNVGQTAYAASKAGIAGFVRATSERLADRGITANAVAPGFIETHMTAAVPMAIREAGRRLSALGQGGLPEDVAQAIVFLASPGAQGITGRTLRICGGAFLGA